MSTIYNAFIPEGWTLIRPTMNHPSGRGKGDLVRYDATGAYALMSMGNVRSVPQRWAQAIHAGTASSEAMTPESRKARAAAGAAARWGKQSYLLTIESWDSIGEYSEETGGSHFFGLTKASETIIGFAAAKARKEQILNEIRAAGRRGCVIMRGPLPYVGGKIFPA